MEAPELRQARAPSLAQQGSGAAVAWPNAASREAVVWRNWGGCCFCGVLGLPQESRSAVASLGMQSFLAA